MTTQDGKLIILTGPSGVGKGTLRKRVVPRIPVLRESISATTRPPRPGEVEGKDYFFVTPQAFDRLVTEEQLLEWETFAGNCYGTPRQFVEDSLSRGEHILLEIEVKGALRVKQLIPHAFLIFIAPPSIDVLAERLKERNTNDDSDMSARLAVAQWEMTQQDKFDAVIINDSLSQAEADLHSLLCHVLSLSPSTPQTHLLKPDLQ